jgi:hypothetical protein
MSSDQDAKLGGLLVCPKCGNDGTVDEILYVEKIELSRRVCGVKNGAVAVELNQSSEDGRDDHAYPCFQCQRLVGNGVFEFCGHRWSGEDAPIVFVPDDD